MTESISGDIPFDCPACRAPCYAGQGAVLHAWPPCAWFLSRSAVEVVRAANRRARDRNN